MPKAKSPRREYDSTRRQAQADETRRHILEAARKLFTERGYVGATAEAIAIEASVALQTVYAIFKNKRKILVSLMNVSSPTGDEDHIPITERSGPQAVARETDQRRQLQMFAEVVAYNLDQSRSSQRLWLRQPRLKWRLTGFYRNSTNNGWSI